MLSALEGYQQCNGGCHDACECIRGYSVRWRAIMSALGHVMTCRRGYHAVHWRVFRTLESYHEYISANHITFNRIK